ncbi:MAG TPA: hypothetical protein VES40_21025 [Ilumatobacteraceae bacterium]|nr:hypothetical protein [Ilumatobacteraceae bacterium]
MDIEVSVRKHGVCDDDMLHALRHHWRGFETNDPDVTLFIGPAANGEPLGFVLSMIPTALRSSMRSLLDPSS